MSARSGFWIASIWRAQSWPALHGNHVDGRQISMDSLAGKVVLIDFWATWCGPCREALPHIQKIARKFDGQPLVVLSISLDSDEDKWKTFVAKNQMTCCRCATAASTARCRRGSASPRFQRHSLSMPMACLKTSMLATRTSRAS